MKIDEVIPEYVFPENETEENQFHYVACMMDYIEKQSYNELVFEFSPTYKGFSVEIYEHEDVDEDEWETWNGLELVDWYYTDTIKQVFDFLMERYV